jgi:micrococcal nuclease
MTYRYNASVVRWVDGDTVILKVDLGFRMSTEASFRLYGVNTPERGQMGYDEAKKFCESCAPVGSNIQVDSHKDDKYGRWLATIYLPDSIDSLNNGLIRKGLAVEYFGGKR